MLRSKTFFTEAQYRKVLIDEFMEYDKLLENKFGGNIQATLL